MDVSWLWIFVLSLLLVAVTSYRYLRGSSSAKTKTKGKIPSLASSDARLGNLGDVGKAGSLHEFLLALHKDHGPTAAFWWADQQVVSIADPALFRATIRLFDRPMKLFWTFAPLLGEDSVQYANGDDGKNRRRTYVDPSFSHGVMGKLAWAFSTAAQRLVSSWTQRVSKSKNIEVQLRSEMLEVLSPLFLARVGLVSLRAVLLSSLGDTCEDDKVLSDLRKAYEACWTDMESRVSGSFPTPESEREKKFNDAVNVLHSTVDRLSEEAHHHNGAHADKRRHSLIDALVEADLSETRMRDEIVTFLVGGFHTTGNLLTWALYYLAKRPDFQERIVRDMAAVLTKDQDMPSMEQLPAIPFIGQVVNEALRCSLLATWVARESDIEVALGEYIVPPKTPIIMATGVVMCDPKIWKNPSEFDPERFSVENVANMPTLAFSPFGFAGKRLCPAQKYAIVEAGMVIGAVLRKFQIATRPQDAPPRKVYGLVTTPAEDIVLSVTPRE